MTKGTSSFHATELELLLHLGACGGDIAREMRRSEIPSRLTTGGVLWGRTLWPERIPPSLETLQSSRSLETAHEHCVSDPSDNNRPTHSSRTSARREELYLDYTKVKFPGPTDLARSGSFRGPGLRVGERFVKVYWTENENRRNRSSHRPGRLGEAVVLYPCRTCSCGARDPPTVTNVYLTFMDTCYCAIIYTVT